jgi:hypothetical protein
MFVLARHDAVGNPLRPVAVEMREYQLEKFQLAC